MAQQVVHGGEIPVHLTDEGRVEGNGLELDNHVATEFQMEEREIGVEVAVADLRQYLPADEGEAGAEFQQEVLHVVDEGLLDLSFDQIRIATPVPRSRRARRAAAQCGYVPRSLRRWQRSSPAIATWRAGREKMRPCAAGPGSSVHPPVPTAISSACSHAQLVEVGAQRIGGAPEPLLYGLDVFKLHVCAGSADASDTNGHAAS